MKKFRLLTAIVAVCMFVGMFSGCTVVDNTSVVTINGEEITKDVFALYLYQGSTALINEAGVVDEEGLKEFWKDESNVAAAKDRAVDEATKTVVKCQKAAEKGITLTDEEKNTLNQNLGAEISQMGSKEDFEKQLKAVFGTSIDAYTDFIETMYLVNKLESTMAAEAEYAISEEEARANIADNYIKAKHILISTVDTATQMPLPEEEVVAAKEKVDDIYKQIQGGADFDALMNEHSQDPGLATAPDGYEFGKGEMVKEFEEAAYALEIGEVSEPVETSYGYHIIKRVDMELTEEKIAQYVPSVTQLLQAEKIDAAFEQLKSEATVEVDEKALSKMEIIQ